MAVKKRLQNYSPSYRILFPLIFLWQENVIPELYMKRKILLCVIVLLEFFTATNAQQKRLDSLLAANHDHLKEDTFKVLLLAEIGKEYRKLKMTKERFQYIEAATELGEKIKFLRPLPPLYNNKGLYYEGRADYERSIANYERAIAICELLNDKAGVADYSLNFGTVYQYIGDYPKALTLYQSAANYYINNGKQADAANCFINIGGVYQEFPDQHENAVIYFEKALKIFQKKGDEARGVAEAYMSIIQTYLSASDAELVRLQIEPSKKYVIARDYLSKAMVLADESKDEQLHAEVEEKIGGVEEKLLNYPAALREFQSTLSIYQKNDRPNLEFTEMLNIGRVYQKQNNFSPGLSYLHMALAGGRKIKALELQRDALFNISTVHENLHHYDSAYIYYKDYVMMRDSISNSEKQKEIMRQQLRFEFAGKEREYKLNQQIADGKIQQQKQEISLRNKQLELTNREKEIQKLSYLQKQAELEGQKTIQANQLKQEQLKADFDKRTSDQQINVQNVQLNSNRRLSVFLALLAVIVFAVAIFIYNSRRKTIRLNTIVSEQKIELEQLINVKDKIFSIVSHDMRTPVNNLIAFSSLLEEGEIGQEKLALYIEQIKGTLDHTSSMMENMLNWSASQMQGFTPVLENINITPIIQHTVDVLTPTLTKKKITLDNNITENIFVRGDKNMAELILRNLISNAVKFSNPGGVLNLSSRHINNNISLSVRDNGVGMNESKVAVINSSSAHGVQSTSGTAKEKGTGLGLMLCKHFAAMMHGNIHVESEPDKGSVFNLVLPAV